MCWKQIKENKEVINIIFMLAFTLALVIVGVYQYNVDSRLKDLQDYFSISVLPNGEDIAVVNTEKINAYIWGFDLPERSVKFNKPRVIAQGIAPINLWLDIPTLEKFQFDKEFIITLYLEDEFGNKWLSEHGAVRNKDKGLVIWSYKVIKEDWVFPQNSTISFCG